MEINIINIFVFATGFYGVWTGTITQKNSYYFCFLLERITRNFW